MGVIYKITNPESKIYIGKSINVEKRFSSYRKLQNCKSQIRLYRSFIKYGVDSHIFEIVEECENCELNEREVFYIKKYDSFATIHGLNLKGGGEGGKVSEETKLKISKANSGKTRTKEQKEKMSKSGKGKHHTILTKEQKEHLRNINLGKKQSIETCLKKSLAMRGRKHSESTLIKLRSWKRKKGFKHSEETKQKMSEGRKGKVSHRKGKIGVFKKETIDKWSEQRKGINNPFFGKRHSTEVMAIIISKRIETMRLKRLKVAS